MKFVCVLLTCASAVKYTETLVSTKNGLVTGVQSENEAFYSYLGIPYAKVDLENPFGEAQDAAPFEGVYQATDGSAVCPQQDDRDFTAVGTLDCLRLNVYVPKRANSDNKLPVMVFFHGGDFSRRNANSNSYGPDFLVTKDVILVTFNYRLGPYGFMSINRSDLPGNAGLRDQLKALQWVNDNIAAFGGDKSKITLFGEGAGAASIEFHMLSERKDLFHKAILQSGTILCDWVMAEPDTEAPIKLASHLGLQTDDMNDALHYLSTHDPRDVIRATLGIGYAESFKPSVEYRFQNVRAMIKDKPSDLLKEELLSNDASFSKPVIIGFNSREEHRLMRDYLQSPEEYFFTAKKTFKAKLYEYFDFDDEELEEAQKLVKYFYIGDKAIGPNTVNEMLEFNSDFTFIYPSLRDSRYYMQADNAPVYLYTFDYAGQRNYMKNRLKLTRDDGPIHGDEIGYLFKQSYHVQPDSTEDMKTKLRMTNMWTDFAKTSNPTPRATALFPFTWRPTKFDLFSYALLSDKCQMTEHPYYDRMAFWDNFFYIYGGKVRW